MNKTAGSLVVLGLASALCAPPVWGQSCHEADPVGPVAQGGGVAVEAKLAIVWLTSAQGRGHAAALTPGAIGRVGRLQGSLRVPIWTLRQEGGESNGFGDMSLRLGVRAFELGRAPVSVELGATLPTGDDERGLGMGHVMLLPGLAIEQPAGRVGWGARTGYARALGGHHDQRTKLGAFGPIVDPMNSSELFLAATAVTRLGNLGWGRLGALYAEPIAVENGRRRWLGGLGLDFAMPSAGLIFGLEAEAPLLGEAHAGKYGIFVRWSS